MRLPQVPPIPEALPLLLVGFVVSPQFLPVPLPIKGAALVALGVLAVVGFADRLADGENLKQGNIQNRQQKKATTRVPDSQWPVGNYDPIAFNNLSITLKGKRLTSNEHITPCTYAGGFEETRSMPILGDGKGLVWYNTEPFYSDDCKGSYMSGVGVNSIDPTRPFGGAPNPIQVGFLNQIFDPVLTTSISPGLNAGSGIPFPQQVPEIYGFGTWLEPQPALMPQRRTLPPLPEVAPPEPEVLPDHTPAEPPGIKPPKAPPIIRPTPRITPKAPPDWQPTGPDGNPEPPPKPDPQTTPDWQEIPWPGAQPIGNPAQQPRPDAVGTAQLLGKLEEKGARIGGNTSPNPPIGTDSIVSLLEKLINFLGTVDPGTDYTLYSPCVSWPDPGSPEAPLVRAVPPVIGGIPALKNRVDALAGLLQDSKLLPQPICAGTASPPPTGEWVTVNFEGKQVSPLGSKPLRKLVRYRDQSFQSLEAHAAHWHHFEWEAGGVVVTHEGLSWGKPRVWAASAAEGKRVLGHAAQVAGVDLTNSSGKWVVHYSDSVRLGQPGRMAVRRLRNGALMVSKRTGADGLAEYPIPTDQSSPT
jgi:hypothetical protein